MEKDLIVIGGGFGGYVAAIRGAQLGAKVTLIEKNKLGGTCLNRGCIPTKALYKNAQFLNSMNHSSEFGVNINGFDFDYTKVQERKRSIVSKLTSGVGQLLMGNGVEVVEGCGSIIDKNTVKVIDKANNTRLITTKNILIATGSKPSMPPIPGADLKGVITSTELLDLESVPKSITIIGGGVIGIEFAGILNSFGSDVTIVEFMPSILPPIDGEIAKKLTAILKKKGIKIETGAAVKSISKNGDKLIVTAEGKKGQLQVECETVLMSTGRELDDGGLNLKSLGINYDRKGIKVDKNYCSTVPGIYAIGDAIGGIMLAHVASEEGKVAVENMMGLKTYVDYDVIPSCVFTFPEIAAVGLTEEEAKSKGISYKVSKFMFAGNGKALTMGESEGFIKIIASSDEKQILGAHIMGPCASDLIHEAVLAMKNMISVDEVATTIHAHPSLSEAFLEAVTGVEGRAIHMAPAKRA
jgi:dihydrolipoamide dehydrogenase